MKDQGDTILAFDHGLKLIGVARVDTFVKLVEPLGDIETDNTAEIKSLIEQYQPIALVVGLPRGLEGQETDQTRSARDFAKQLEQYLLPVHLQDEALTSKQAEEIKSDNQSEHAVAAGIILEDYLRENP